MSRKSILTAIISITILGTLLSSCSNTGKKADAYGNFEANEVIVSSEATGKIINLSFDEGQNVETTQTLGVIDTVQLSLKRDQIIASMGTIGSKVQDIQSQIDVIQKRKANLLREKARVERLLKDSAATTKQLDDINGEIDVLDKQMNATTISLRTVNQGLLSEKNPLSVQIKQINDQIAKSYIKSPIKGTVLTKYVEQGEFATMGKPLFKVADNSELILRVYISGGQLSAIKLNQNVEVKIDKNDGNMQSLTGKVIWVSEKAEFTPKIIQTKEERVNLVYAVKITVKNDGALKIGMPAEVYFK